MDREQPTSELLRVVAVAEGVKKIVLDTFRVQLLARNALVQARHAGADARGFGEVSRHMGTLSRDLDTQMRGLWELSATWVNAVSSRLRLLRSTRYFEAALAGAPPDLGTDDARARAARRREEIEAQVAGARDALSARFDDLDRLATMGSVLARSAKIEATYGNERREILSELSQDFARTADVIYASLKSLRKQVSDDQDSRPEKREESREEKRS